MSGKEHPIHVEVGGKGQPQDQWQGEPPPVVGGDDEGRRGDGDRGREDDGRGAIVPEARVEWKPEAAEKGEGRVQNVGYGGVVGEYPRRSRGDKEERPHDSEDPSGRLEGSFEGIERGAWTEASRDHRGEADGDTKCTSP